MTVHGIGLLAYETPPVPVIRLWDCGVTWKDINPAKGVFLWDGLDQMAGLGRGLLVLGATPQWAARDPLAPSAPWIGPGSSSPPRLLTDWDTYVRKVVTRYGDWFDYQIWNEPQSSAFWNPITQIDRLGVMTKRANAIIKQAAPLAKVVAPPVLPRPSSGGLKRGARVLKSLRDSDWPVDVFSFHAYPEQGEGSARYQWMIDETKAALRLLGAPSKPLWCTEVNTNLLHGPLPEAKQLAFMRGVEAASERRGVKRVYWYAYNHQDARVLGIPFAPGDAGTRLLSEL